MFLGASKLLGAPGRDFMGQGAPPISQQLKQLVDVEAQGPRSNADEDVKCLVSLMGFYRDF